MRVVGLSGSIATGKSTVTNSLRQRGIAVIDCDEIAKQAVQKGSWGFRRVVTAFGSQILTPEGDIDREKLGNLVFGDRVARQKLNKATHLPVGLELARQILWHWLRCTWLVVVDMPLLFETGFYRLTSANVLVSCNHATQVERLVNRDRISQQDAELKIKAQMPLEAKRVLADYIIDNSGNLAQLHTQVAAVFKSLSNGAAWQGAVMSPVSLALLLSVLWKIWS